MKYLIFLIAIALIVACDKPTVLPFGLNAAEATKPHPINIVSTQTDAEFLIMVADAGLFEMEIGKLALIGGNTPEVRSFGAMMVNEYSNILEGAKNVADSKKVKLPSTLGEEGWKKINSMADKHGKNFDDTYIEMIINHHQKCIHSFKEKMKDNSTNSDMKTWLIQAQPVLDHNLTSILEIKEICSHRRAS